MSIWTLVVCGDEVSTDVYTSEQAVYDDLRAGWYVPEDLPNEQFIDWIEGEYPDVELHIDEHADPVSPVVASVVKLWNDEGGWLPGCSYARLAEALGVDPDRLTHYKPGIGRHYPAADHTNGGIA